MRKLTFGLCAVFLIWAAIYFVDDPVAHFVHTHPLADTLRLPAQDMPVLIGLAGVVVLASAIQTLNRTPLRKLQEVLVIASFSLASSACLDEFALKPFFGRLTPDESLKSGTDKFHWFQGSLASSFPSSYAAQIVSVGTILCTAYPKHRSIWLTLIGVGLAALVLDNLHFVSDVLAGGGVGLIVGFATMILWRSRSQ